MPIQTVLSNQGDSKLRVPVKIWAPVEEVESAAMEQLKNTASLPFVFKHVAAMPDVHLGFGATVGSVIATQGAICPAAVGVDIGCGMIAAKTSLYPEQVLDILPKIRASIERSIPVGFSVNKVISPTVEGWSRWKEIADIEFTDAALIARALSQMGSLGGGNHFIELCLDTERNVWVMLHSGSRNIGKTLAERHIDSAKGLMKKMLIELADPDLAYLPEATAEFDAYWKALQWCQDYAYQNRQEMMARVLKDLSYAVYGENGKITTDITVNCHHNYCEREHHFGQNVLVTRKGAVRARENDMGIIPGSMGTRSYIVKGLGNPDSFNSCSHGAGRRMSRGEAKRRFTVEDLIQQTSGIECRKDEDVLDEIPAAYKDIDRVMANQTDLVSIVATLKQVLCVKG